MNATTTAMQEALINSSVPLPPLNKRLWLYIKDNPGICATKLVPIFKISEDIIRVNLRQMVLRGMLDVVKEPRLVKGGYTGSNMRPILLYSTPPKMKEFELLPLSKRSSKIKPAKAKLAPVQGTYTVPQAKDLQQTEAHATASTITATTRPVIDVDKLTIAEARALYAALQRLFGRE